MYFLYFFFLFIFKIFVLTSPYRTSGSKEGGDNRSKKVQNIYKYIYL